MEKMMFEFGQEAYTVICAVKSIQYISSEGIHFSKNVEKKNKYQKNLKNHIRKSNKCSDVLLKYSHHKLRLHRLNKDWMKIEKFAKSIFYMPPIYMSQITINRILINQKKKKITLLTSVIYQARSNEILFWILFFSSTIEVIDVCF